MSIESLLHRVDLIRKHHENLQRVSGERFNIFEILGLTTNEVRVHSAFLAEMLSPAGSHGQGAVFLELFADRFALPPMDFARCKVEVEKTIGVITDDGTEGGRVDILISDNKGCCVAIENKIYAGDQPNQLVRYKNYLRRQGRVAHSLIYLTLDGKLPEQFSCVELVEGEDYVVASYETDIVEWLEACRKESAMTPVVREGITHYINLIKTLTNQTMSKAMKDEIIQTITTSADTFRSAETIASHVNYAKHGLQWKLWKLLRQKLTEKGLTVKTSEEDPKTATSTMTYDYYHARRYTHSWPGLWIELKELVKDNVTVHWGAEIEANFYTGFTVEKNGEGGVSNEPEFAYLRDAVLQVDPSFVTDSAYWLGWKYSEPKLDFRYFGTDQMYNLVNDAYMDKIVSEIADRAYADITSLIARLK